MENSPILIASENKDQIFVMLFIPICIGNYSWCKWILKSEYHKTMPI